MIKIMEIKAILDRREGSFAVLILPDKNSVSWPLAWLPPDSREGEIFTITIARQGEEEEEKRRQSAKDILNEILSRE